MQVNAALSKRATPAPKKARQEDRRQEDDREDRRRRPAAKKPAAKKADGPSLPSLPTNPFADDGKKPVAKKPVAKKKVAKKAKKPDAGEEGGAQGDQVQGFPGRGARQVVRYVFICCAMRSNLESSAYLEIRGTICRRILDVAHRTRARDGIDRAFERDRARSTGGAIDDRSRVDGDERARSNARSIAIRRWARGRYGVWMGCVCVMFDGEWGVCMGRVDG